jgi:hypothetical protein
MKMSYKMKLSDLKEFLDEMPIDDNDPYLFINSPNYLGHVYRLSFVQPADNGDMRIEFCQEEE